MLKSMRCLNFAACRGVRRWRARAKRSAFPAAICSTTRSARWRRRRRSRSRLGDGFQNPGGDPTAPTARRIRGTAVALNTGTDRGVSAQLAAVAVALPQRDHRRLFRGARGDQRHRRTRWTTRSRSAATFRTARSCCRCPALGDRIEHVTSGVAVRYRTGEVDGVRALDVRPRRRRARRARVRL